MIWFLLKCLGVIFIRIKVKGYLKNITENELYNFEEKAIRNKNKIVFSNDGVKSTLKINDREVVLIREGNDFINSFIFKDRNSSCNYILKDNNYCVDIDIDTIMIDIGDGYIYIKYIINDSKCEYEYKIEMSDI